MGLGMPCQDTRFVCCLNGGEYSGLGCFAVFEFRGVKSFQERAYDTEAFLFSGDLSAWGEYAQCGIGSDLLDDLFGRLGGPTLGRLGFGEVEAGDLEAVEEQAGAARVDVVGGDAAEDFADGGLDGGAVFRQGQVECGATAATPVRVCDRLASVVVVVAEFFLAEAWTGAAVSVGEDVAALVLFGCFGCVLHGSSPRVLFCTKSSNKRR